MDPVLLEQARQGDERAFEALAVTSHPRLFRAAFAILRDARLAEDATQLALIDIWRFLRRLPDAERFEAWSYRALIDACRAEAEREAEAVAADPTASEAEPPVSDLYRPVVDHDQLSRGFACLSIGQRAAIVMRHLLDLPSVDAAMALDVPEDQVDLRVEGALDALGAALDPDTGSGAAAIVEAGGAT